MSHRECGEGEEEERGEGMIKRGGRRGGGEAEKPLWEEDLGSTDPSF